MNNFLLKIISNIRDNLFQCCLIIILLGIFIFRTINDGVYSSNNIAENTQIEHGVHIFIHPQCPHCHDEKRFIDSVISKYPKINIKYYDITQNGNFDKMIQFASKFNIKMTELGTPALFTNDNVLIGFERPETTGAQLETMFNNMSQKISVPVEEQRQKERYLDLPVFGKVDLVETSLPVLSIIIGLADGFNPCAMWVLVYLISVIAGMNDRRKIWLLVGAFVFSSGVLYFLFMTAWLNAFLFIGYTKILSAIVGIIALYIGAISVYTFIKNHGEMQCSLENNETRTKTMERIRSLASRELSFISLIGIVSLAFVVNSIEFVCSFALPSVYTCVLSQAHISSLLHYTYILMYTFFYMLDDLIVFGLAAFAVNKYVGTKYAKYSTIIGGGVMLILGIYLIFFNVM